MAGNPLVDAILRTSSRIGANPLDLATTMSYETAGTFDPWKAGPTTQWGQHRGLIQMGEPQRAKYGVTKDTPVADQVEAAGNYLQDAGFRPGMGLLDLYSAVNAGRVGRYNASDANNGGAPGTVADKVNQQMEGHRAKAAALLGGDFSLAPAMTMPTTDGSPAPRSGAFGVSGVEPSVSPAPQMAMPDTVAKPDDGLDIAKLLQGLTTLQPSAQPVQQPQAATPSVAPAPQPRPATPFDASAFYALLARKR